MVTRKPRAAEILTGRKRGRQTSESRYRCKFENCDEEFDTAKQRLNHQRIHESINKLPGKRGRPVSGSKYRCKVENCTEEFDTAR